MHESWQFYEETQIPSKRISYKLAVFNLNKSGKTEIILLDQKASKLVIGCENWTMKITTPFQKVKSYVSLHHCDF